MKNKKPVVVITGGTFGLGLAVAQRFTHDGYDVVISGRSQSRLDQACAAIGPEVVPVVADVGTREGAAALATATLEKFGRVDVLVNNAGIMETTTLDTPLDELEQLWDQSMQTNAKGVLLTTYALAPHLTTPGGRIINLGSIVANTGGSVPGMLAYAASKAAVHGLTFSLARELAPKKITVNIVSPGMIGDTGMTGTFDEERKARIREVVPLGLAGQPSDVAGAVAWLASDSADFVTGAVIPVNGGWLFG